jgi:brefeldin A-resistance guanine nucleotide exchange factor 1
VPESIKNILLVMADSGYLAPPEEKPENRELWEQTWKNLDRFLPNLRKELFPEAPKEPKPSKHKKTASVDAKDKAEGQS